MYLPNMWAIKSGEVASICNSPQEQVDEGHNRFWYKSRRRVKPAIEQHAAPLLADARRVHCMV